MAGKLGFSFICAMLCSLSPAAADDCPLDASATGRVAAIVSGDSLVLDSGLPVRLAAISVPAAPGLDARARAALNTAVAGREVEIRLAAPDPDRYGRALAHVFVTGEAPVWLQSALLADGLAEVRTTPSDASCARALLAVEAAARDAHVGLWADPAYAAFRATDPGLARRSGLYHSVEGLVVSTGSTERTFFLNFGYDWSTDFTVTMSTADAGAFDFGGLKADALTGHWVRVRGWIEERDGATIRIDHAEQIEILDGGK
jgi:endonuclease YncB( thermonuclease family)